MSGRYSLHFQVKHLLGFVISANGTPWMVFETGDNKVWLFCQGFPEGYAGNKNCFVSTGLQNPVEESRLVNEVRRALSAGVNVDMRCSPPFMYSERMTLEHIEVVRRSKIDPISVSGPADAPPQPKRLRR